MHKLGNYFCGNFDFLYDDEYQEERERSDSRYSRSKKIKIYQKELAGTKWKIRISFQNFLNLLCKCYNYLYDTPNAAVL